MKLIAITTTSDDKSVLESIAKELLKNQLAACVQISGPIDSWYRWEGEVKNSTEWQCLIKTSEQLFRQVRNTITNLHNYELPQVVSFDIAGGSKKYLLWLTHNLTNPPTD